MAKHSPVPYVSFKNKCIAEVLIETERKNELNY